MLPWGESATLSEELTRESAHGGVPRLLLAVQVDYHDDGDDDDAHRGVPTLFLVVHVAMVVVVIVMVMQIRMIMVTLPVPTKVFRGFCLSSMLRWWW